MTSFDIRIFGHLAIFTLTNGAQHNLLTPDAAENIAAAITQLSADPDIKALAITGSAGAFCSGADLTALQQAAAGDGSDLQRIYTAFTSVASSHLFTIALVNGPAVGAGMNLAMACDIRLASPNAWFESRFFQLAIHPGGGHTWLLPQLLGWQQASAMIFAAEKLNAQQALHHGFIKEIVPEDELVTRAKQFTAGLATVPTALVKQTKQTMLAMRQCQDLSTAVATEFEAQFASLQQDAALQQIAQLKQKLTRGAR